MSVTDHGPVRTEPLLDPRGVRFSAALTSVVVVLVLLSSSGWLAAAQAVVFGVGSIAGMRFAPYGVLYRSLLAPRLGPPAGREDPAPVRFSQTVGLVFMVVAAAGYLSGLTVLGLVAAAFALVAALLNAVFGFCLGCEMYALTARLRAPRPTGA
jgi:hypothetical protein